MSRYLAQVPGATLKMDADATQVDMSAASLRPGRELTWLAALRDRLLTNVSASSAAITAYVGSFLHDIDQARPKLLRVTKRTFYWVIASVLGAVFLSLCVLEVF